MFSYLHGMRPNSRRSALPPPTTPPNATATRQYHHTAFSSPEPSHLPPPSRQSDSNTPSPIASTPPILPPIPRVASQHEPEEPEESKASKHDVEDKATQISMGSMAPPRPSTTSEQKGIRPRGLSLKDRPDGIARSETMPEFSSRHNRPSQTQERRQDQPTITHTPAPMQTQRPPTKPVPKPTDIPLPLPRPNRQLSQPPPKPPLHVKSHTNPTKPAKTKFNLLNPMSLLARRRSSHAVAEASRDKYYRTEQTNVPPLRLPDNYDPRIRGKVVHDFDNAPRSARSGLHSEAGTPPKSANGQEPQFNSPYIVRGPTTDEDSPSSTEKEHTPVFKEHFDDGVDSWQEGREGPIKRPKSGFMYKVALQEPGPHPDPSSLPAFARNLPSSFPTDREPVSRVASPPRPPLEVVLEAALSESLPKTPSLISSPPTSPPLKARSRASSATDPSFIPAGLPKHFKSNASRFSFDLGGVGSTAQEQLLEEKHRQKAKEKARLRASLQEPQSQHDVEDDGDSVYSEDMMDDDGLEEKIPGVNADAEDESVINHVFPDVGPFAGLPLATTFVNPMSSLSEGLSSPETLRDHYERLNAVEPPSSLNALPNIQNDLQNGRSLLDILQPPPTVLQNISVAPEAQREVTGAFEPLDAKLPGQQSKELDDEDDMYFDDGMIEDMEDDDGPAFDESQFDDETSRVYGVPIRDLPKAQPLQDFPVPEAAPIAPQYDGGVDMISEELRDSLPDLNQANRPVFSQTAGLTQDNLAAYHDALAFAANQAALNGKFIRQQSVQSQDSYQVHGIKEDPDHDPIPVGESPSLEINGLPLSRTLPTNDDYDFDDALSDDAIIAEANAEALENDDEGFYGQEFGFFARANGAGEYANGGYFGQGIMRSHSGHNAEPALTPITERSEWSNRNSAINLAMHGYSQVSLPQQTPGIAQLAEHMMHLEEDNMSLSALMKLRRGAWGSSTTSLQSSSGNSGSPLTYLPPIASNPAALPYQQQPQGSYPPVIMQQGMGNSTYSLASSNGFVSDDSSASDHSNTITLQNLPGISIPPNTARGAPYMQTSYSNSGSDSSPVQSRPRSGLVPISGNGNGNENGNGNGNGKGKGEHSRHGSGSGDRGSVSYVHERDGDGERWVLEKRRVGEGGLVEVLGREIVEGGRI